MKSELYLNIYFISAVFTALFSVFSFEFKHIKLALGSLFVSSILLGVWVALADPFIHTWDEQYHALVAKNLLQDPLKPVLVKDTVLGSLSTEWSGSNIWLHKQPLFLWQMALSLKIFGLNELGVRGSSILMHALMIFFVYRVGKLISIDRIGFYSALVYTFSYFPLEYISGSYSTDHNDIAFLFYSFGSIWSLMEYYYSDRKIFLIATGLFAGGAVLCKWLTGLLVYGIWVMLIYFNRGKKPVRYELKNILLSGIICLTVFVPWQLFCLSQYPNEYSRSMAFNVRHITQALEGHGGDRLFYYNALYEQFGEGVLVPPLMIVSLLFTIYSLKNKNYALIFLCTAAVTYIFFTYVKTKMYGYVFVVIPLFILSFTYSGYFLFEKLKIKIFDKYEVKNLVFSLLMITLTYFFFQPEKFYKRHSLKEDDKTRVVKQKEKDLFHKIYYTHQQEKCLVFNCKTSINSHILCMFYTGFPSYLDILYADQIQKLKSLNYHLIAIDDGHLPDYILMDASIEKIKS